MSVCWAWFVSECVVIVCVCVLEMIYVCVFGMVCVCVLGMVCVCVCGGMSGTWECGRK